MRVMPCSDLPGPISEPVAVMELGVDITPLRPHVFSTEGALDAGEWTVMPTTPQTGLKGLLHVEVWSFKVD